jgi:3'(2'), 5'-bisphosphate nucleotidase
MYYAAPGAGAFVEEKWSTKRLRVEPVSDPSRMVMAMSRSHPSRKVQAIGEKLGVSKYIQSGSVGLKFGLIAEGRAHLYINTSSATSQWDTCAPEAILREAGGVVTDCNGEALVYNRPEIRNLRGILASNGTIHDRAFEVTAEVLAEYK